MSRLCAGAGQHIEEVQKVELWFWWAVWWLGLGILSSIGLGTGMHSGLLFLFPHMLKVILPPPCGYSCAGSHSPGHVWAAHLSKAGKESARSYCCLLCSCQRRQAHKRRPSMDS